MDDDLHFERAQLGLNIAFHILLPTIIIDGRGFLFISA